MDYFHWKLDEPGNTQGIVLAYNEEAAKMKVLNYIEDLTYPVDQIMLEWLSSDSSDVFEINEL